MNDFQNKMILQHKKTNYKSKSIVNDESVSNRSYSEDQEKDLKDEIDDLRKKMVELAVTNKDDLQSEEVQEISKTLDRKIIEYYSCINY